MEIVHITPQQAFILLHMRVGIPPSEQISLLSYKMLMLTPESIIWDNSYLSDTIKLIYQFTLVPL